MAWGFESNRITTMRYIVMIKKLKLKYSLIKINMILPKKQLLNYRPETVKEKFSSHSSQ